MTTNFIKPILKLTKTLIGNLQGFNGLLLRTRLSKNISSTSKKNYGNKIKDRTLNNIFEKCS
jgi:hypothetical protein